MTTSSLSPEGQASQPPSADVLAMFLGTFSALLPALPPPEDGQHGDQGLSARHFRAVQPKYAVSPPKQAVAEMSSSIHSAGSMKTLGPSSSSDSLWSMINNVTGELTTNLAQLAFDSQAKKPADSSSRYGTLSLGGFLLLVQVLARNLDNESLGVAQPHQWSRQDAEDLLEKSLPILMAGLGTRLPPTVSASGGAALGGAGALADAALLWLMWCCEGFYNFSKEANSPLKETIALPVVQLLASHAALSAIPTARHISVYMLKEVLVHHMEEKLALAEIKDLIVETSYPPLKAACVGLLKDILDAKASQQNSVFWTRSALNDLLQAILIPVELPQPSGDGDRDFEASYGAAFNALEEKTSWISEVSNLLYYIYRRDSEDQVSWCNIT